MHYALVGAHPLVTVLVVVHPFFTISHLSFMNVGDHLPNSFLVICLMGKKKILLHHMWRRQGF
jgi:hypothetical protein